MIGRSKAFPVKVGRSLLSEWLPKARAFHIEYNGFLSNHLSHNLIVMSAMGAPEDKLRWWWDFYTEHHSEPAHQPKGKVTISSDNWKDHLQASRELYPEYLEYFDSFLESHGMDQTISTHFPTLAAGLAGALLHPVIHAGLGVQAGSNLVVAEGLAYMATAFQPLCTGADEEGEEKLDINLEKKVLPPIAATVEFVSLMKQHGLVDVLAHAIKTPKYLARKIGGAQHGVVAFDDPDLPLGKVLASIELKLPAEDEPLEPAIHQVTALMAATYLGTDCEFVVIHGNTSLMSVLATFDALNPKEQREVLLHWWRAVMAAIASQRLPKLDAVFEIVAQWEQECAQEGSGESKENKETQASFDDAEWPDILSKSWDSKDEHVQKGVYCLWQWSQWDGMPAASVKLFKKAALNQVRPHPSGQLGNHLWFGNGYKPAPL